MEQTTMPRNHKKTFLLFFILLISLTAFATMALANYSTIKIDAAVVNVRTGPGLSYDTMTQIGAGDRVNILEEKNNWYKVRLSNDKIGWVASWLVNNTEISAATNTMGTVTGEKINIRSESNDQAAIIGSVTKGTELTVLYQENGWTQIQYNQQVAWISSKFIDVKPASVQQEAPTTVSTTDEKSASIKTITIRNEEANIRSAPGTTSSLVTTATKGQNFDYVGTSGDWYHIRNDAGIDGYVASWLVDLSADTSSAPLANVSSLAEATVVIDAGHGGDDPGAEASTFYEKEATLKTAQTLAAKLKAVGANVILTRDSDKSVSLRQRPAISNQAKADVFISIHYDSTENPNDGSGTTTYYYHERDKALAKIVNEGLTNGPLPNNGVRFGDFQVTRENTQPALLLELGYVNNTTDSSMINTDSYRGKISNTIVQSLNQYFKK